MYLYIKQEGDAGSALELVVYPWIIIGSTFVPAAPPEYTITTPKKGGFSFSLPVVSVAIPVIYRLVPGSSISCEITLFGGEKGVKKVALFECRFFEESNCMQKRLQNFRYLPLDVDYRDV